jgi:hypothetical protein
MAIIFSPFLHTCCVVASSTCVSPSRLVLYVSRSMSMSAAADSSYMCGRIRQPRFFGHMDTLVLMILHQSRRLAHSHAMAWTLTQPWHGP